MSSGGKKQKKKSSNSPNESLSQSGPWQCVKCGCPENLTPVKRLGPDGQRNICNACYIKNRAQKERGMKGSARPNLTNGVRFSSPYSFNISQPHYNAFQLSPTGSGASQQYSFYPSAIPIAFTSAAYRYDTNALYQNQMYDNIFYGAQAQYMQAVTGNEDAFVFSSGQGVVPTEMTSHFISPSASSNKSDKLSATNYVISPSSDGSAPTQNEVTAQINEAKRSRSKQQLGESNSSLNAATSPKKRATRNSRNGLKDDEDDDIKPVLNNKRQGQTI